VPKLHRERAIPPLPLRAKLQRERYLFLYIFQSAERWLLIKETCSQITTDQTSTRELCWHCFAIYQLRNGPIYDANLRIRHSPSGL